MGERNPDWVPHGPVPDVNSVEAPRPGKEGVERIKRQIWRALDKREHLGRQSGNFKREIPAGFSQCAHITVRREHDRPVPQRGQAAGNVVETTSIPPTAGRNKEIGIPTRNARAVIQNADLRPALTGSEQS
jgi:hypothetical protein